MNDTELDSSGQEHEFGNLDPGVLCIMHLETLATPPSAAAVAYLLGNDAETIREYIDFNRQQEEMATADALEEQLSDEPDFELAEVHLGEARVWARGVSQGVNALNFVLSASPPEVDFCFTDELRAIRRAERSWLDPHAECRDSCGTHWDRTAHCPTHGDAIIDGKAAEQATKRALRNRVNELVRLQSLPMK